MPKVTGMTEVAKMWKATRPDVDLREGRAVARRWP
jgi:hypothetical protein